MYSRCRDMKLSREVFQEMKQRNVVTWSSFILGCVTNGESHRALDMFTGMEFEPDSFTYVAILKACGKLAAQSFGQYVHVGIAVGTSLMDFYVKCASKCASVSKAELLFYNMHCPDVVAWNSLISGYSSTGDSDKVFFAMKNMEEAGTEMNGVTFLCVLSVCSHAGRVDEAITYFQRMLRYGICATPEIYNCLVDVLYRANRLNRAIAIANMMQFNSNVVTRTTLLAARLY